MRNNFYAVIMAGGIGSRLAPLSTPEKPKQFHDILNTGETLLQTTFNRLNGLVASENILIATNKKYKDLVTKQLPKINENQLVLEPALKNTAPCILYSALKIYNQNPNAVIAVLPADHWIPNTSEFQNELKKVLDFCSENDFISTLGITPKEANTGYGYIKFKASENEIKEVEKFTEKPDLETAKKFIQNPNYLWNAGIFVWSVKAILNEFKTHLPEMFTQLNTEENIYNTEAEVAFIAKNYPKVTSISIDYGIIEKSNHIFVLPTSFEWNDLGSWEAVNKELEKKKK